MTIKVVMNYPKTKEGWELYNNSLAKSILRTLRDMLSPKDLDKLIEMLKEKVAENNSARD